jgi:hypothetical protein
MQRRIVRPQGLDATTIGVRSLDPTTLKSGRVVPCYPSSTCTNCVELNQPRWLNNKLLHVLDIHLVDPAGMLEPGALRGLWGPSRTSALGLEKQICVYKEG